MFGEIVFFMKLWWREVEGGGVLYSTAIYHQAARQGAPGFRAAGSGWVGG